MEALAEGTGISDEALLEKLAAHGLDAQSVQVLHLVPLLAVAWADGELQADEAALLREAADKHGLSDGARAHFEAFLKKAPKPALVDTAIDFIRALLSVTDDDDAEAKVQDLASLALNVASAAGNVL